MFTYNLSIFLTSTAFVVTNTKTRYASYEMYRVFENCPLEQRSKDLCFLFARNKINEESLKRKAFDCFARRKI